MVIDKLKLSDRMLRFLIKAQGAGTPKDFLRMGGFNVLYGVPILFTAFALRMVGK